MGSKSPYDTFPRCNQPRVKTRLIEELDILRTGISELEVSSSDSNGVTLEAKSVEMIRGGTASDEDMFDMVEGRQGPGLTVRVDAVRPKVFRVRFAVGDCGTEVIPNISNPMLVKDYASPPEINIACEDHRVNLNTKFGQLEMRLDKWEMLLVDSNGDRCLQIGGEEQNNFGKWDSHSLGFCRNQRDDIDKAVAVECFELDQDEGIYGFGEDFMGLNKNGHTIDLYHEDACGTMTPRAYKNIPFYLSTRGYGVYVNMPARMTFWVGSRMTNSIQLSVEDNYLDYFLILGDNMKEVIGNYTMLTGRSPVPPKWSFGLWMSKITYKSEEEVMAVAKNLRKKKIPADVIHLDTGWFEQDWVCDLEFSKERFPDPEGMMKRLKAMGFRVSLWQQPYVRQASKLFKEAMDGGFFVKNKIGVLSPSPIRGVIDYTNPEAIEWLKEKFIRLFDLGAAAIKTDFGESAPDDGHYYDGTPAHRMHNLYPLIYNRTIFEVTEQCTGEGLVWGRSATAGNQRYPLYWGGDNSSYFSNIQPSLCGGLSLGICGFSFWSQDIGGFHGMPTAELMIRWMQVGLFGSHARVHGRNDREPYRFGEECERICREMLGLRSRLMPYIYSQSISAAKNGLPLMRPLVLEFEADRNVRDISDQFMFGEDLMLAPILKEGEVKRDIYFPAGVWYHWWSGEKIESQDGLWRRMSVPLDEIGLFVRGSSIIPLGPLNQYVDEHPLDELMIYVFPGEGDIEIVLYDGKKEIVLKYMFEEKKIFCDCKDIDLHIKVFG